MGNNSNISDFHKQLTKKLKKPIDVAFREKRILIGLFYKFFLDYCKGLSNSHRIFAKNAYLHIIEVILYILKGL
jgi:D-alanyl-lipoteichoic acid acyltransferase DltB (MBOAT superfamily)